MVAHTLSAHAFVVFLFLRSAELRSQSWSRETLLHVSLCARECVCIKLSKSFLHQNLPRLDPIAYKERLYILINITRDAS